MQALSTGRQANEINIAANQENSLRECVAALESLGDVGKGAV